MAKAKTKSRYFEVKPILKKYPKARYYFLLGGRGTGKTYPVIAEAITDAIKGKGMFAYVRRYKESITGFQMDTLIACHNDLVAKLTNDRWNRIAYWRRRFYLEKWEHDDATDQWMRIERSKEPIGAAYSLSTWETDKGADFGFESGIAHIIVDEVLSKAGHYLTDEWGVVQNVISSLVRDRWEQDTKIWFLANPISKWANPYIRNMGITKNMLINPGITEIKYPDDSGNGVAMTAVFANLGLSIDEIDPNRLAVYNTFFAFPNSKGKSKSITHGYWEMEDSSRLPSGVYQESDKLTTLYAIFQEEKLAIDIMKYTGTGQYYMLIYPTENIRPRTYYFLLGTSLDKYAIIGNATHPMATLLNTVYKSGRVYYSDDSTADAWHGFLVERRKYTI